MSAGLNRHKGCGLAQRRVTGNAFFGLGGENFA
jgi:hypothetical protein